MKFLYIKAEAYENAKEELRPMYIHENVSFDESEATWSDLIRGVIGELYGNEGKDIYLLCIYQTEGRI